MNNSILRTPLIPYRTEVPIQNGKIFLKPENLQPFGSYKIRGVKSAIEHTPIAVLRQGISAASAGNMAQPVAYWAQKNSLRCQIFVPDSAPQIKKDAIVKLKAQLIELPFAQVWDLIKNPPQNHEGLFIHPVFTKGLLEGYGAIADELIFDLATLNAVIIPFGVGGLTLGIARRMKKINPRVLIYACEPETAAPLKASLKLGSAKHVQRIASFVDAIGTPEVLPEVFDEVKNLIEDSLVVTLDEVRAAMIDLAHTHKLICEGAAAASLAAAIQLNKENPSLKIACVLTGGNTSEFRL